MRWRAALLGLVILAAPGIPAAMLLRGGDEPRTWHASPPEPPSAPAKPPASWDEPARESLASLRHIVLIEARRSASSLAVCETRARRAPAAHRNLNFRRCATAPLARTDGFARSNSQMLAQLAATAGPTNACRGRVLTLSESASGLAFIARETLHGARRAVRPGARRLARHPRAGARHAGDGAGARLERHVQGAPAGHARAGRDLRKITHSQ